MWFKKMLNFKSPTPEDKDWVRAIFRSTDTLGCDNCFGNIFFWRNFSKIKILKYENFILRCYTDNVEKYRFPFGSGSLKEAVEILMQDAYEKRNKMIFSGITESEKDKLQKIIPGKFDYIEERNKEDYVYNTKDLIELKGKKYHSKRNHVVNFKRLYNWSYEDIGKDNLDECKKFTDLWFERNLANKGDKILEEKKALSSALSYFDYFDLMGGIIRVDSKITALTIAEKINNKAVDICFEKAFTEYNGIYAVINNEFAKRNLMSFDYINREEDLGIEGLRKSKSSYHPAMLIKRYEAIYKGD